MHAVVYREPLLMHRRSLASWYHFDRQAAASRTWMSVRKFFPNVRQPIFHATPAPIGPWLEGLKAGGSHRHNGPAQVGISLTRNLTFALSGQFGRYVIVLDAAELRQRYELRPVQYGSRVGWNDEYEERAMTNHIPTSLFHGAIIDYPSTNWVKSWSEFPWPVVYQDTKDKEWHSTKESP